MAGVTSSHQLRRPVGHTHIMTAQDKDQIRRTHLLPKTGIIPQHADQHKIILIGKRSGMCHV